MEAQGVQTPTAFNVEYSIIQRDLLRVIILNVLYLAGILILYYTNKNTHYLEQWFNNVFHF